MAADGMFPGLRLEGPMPPDLALSVEAARAAGAKPDFAGRVDVLIAPTMEAAIMVLRTLTGLAGGLAAGLVLGARVPIVAPARGDSMETRMASCVLAALAVAGARDPAERDARVPATARGAKSVSRAAA
jgi:phosphate acetyltransferase